MILMSQNSILKRQPSLSESVNTVGIVLKCMNNTFWLVLVVDLGGTAYSGIDFDVFPKIVRNVQ